MNAFGEAVRMARRWLGLTGTQLASAIGATQAAVSRFENGDREPDAKMLQALADALSVTPDLLRAGHGMEGPLATDAHMRRRATSKVSDWRRAEAQLNLLWLQANKVAQATDMTPKLMLPVVDPFGSSPEDAARLTRGQWHMPLGPVKGLTRWVEAAGVFIVTRDLGTPRIDGLSQRRGAISVVLLNSTAPIDRRRLTLAHELGHLVLHNEYADPDMELQANQFAAEILMPEAAIKPFLHDLTLARLEAMKLEWGVSMQALIQRAVSLNTMDRSRQAALYKQLSSRGQRVREPGSDRIPDEPAQMIHSLASSLRARGIAESRIRTLAGVTDYGHPASLFPPPPGPFLSRVK